MKIFSQKIRAPEQNTIHNEDVLRKPKIPQSRQKLQTKLSYQNNRLFYQGKNLSSFLKNHTQTHPAIFSQIARELELYRDKKEKEAKRLLQNFRLSEEKESEISHMLALCDAYLARLSEIMQNKYTSLASGCQVEFDENGQLILNGINVHQILKRYRQYPNQRLQVYLKGLANRLYTMLGQTHRNRLYFRLQETLLFLYQEIQSELQLALA